VRSALHQAERTLTARIVGRLLVDAASRLRALIAADVPDDDTGEELVLALIKAVPGNVSLDSMLTEIRKLRAVRAFGLPAALFADVGPRGRILACQGDGGVSVAPAGSPRAADADPARGAVAHRLREITDTWWTC